jgi:hypothetical protein
MNLSRQIFWYQISLRRELIRINCVFAGLPLEVCCPPFPVQFRSCGGHVIKTLVASWYFDLNRLFSYRGDEGSTKARVFHHTAPIANLYALREALRLIQTEGMAARFARHQHAHNLFVAVLDAIGLSLFTPQEHRTFVTDKLRSCGAALREVGAADRQETGRWLNNRAENSHLPFRRRERAMQRFRRMRSLQMFAAVHASVFNHFNSERSFYSRANFKKNRAAALAEWRGLCPLRYRFEFV